MKKLIYLLPILFLAITATAQTTTIHPTWGQSIHYANEAGNIFWVITGMVLISAMFILAIIASKGIIQSKAINVICFVLLALGLTSILSKPTAIRFNNDKVVETNYLNVVGEKHIWDSLENNCLIVDGPYNCDK